MGTFILRLSLKALRWGLSLWLVFILLLLVLRFLPPPVSAFMLQADQNPVQYQWRDWEQLSPHLAQAAVAAEDQRFPLHYGLDWVQIEAAINDYQKGQGLRGASTITQQVCKNLFLWPGGGLFRKGIEAFCAGNIEVIWGKRRILEMYLNIAEFAPGIYGVEAAAQHFFQQEAYSLNREQSALMMAVLPNPKALHIDTPSDYVQQRQAWIMQQMRQLGASHLQALQP
ncbi:MAG: monofunctional biosynthetic peptidoglycan transglycosylase [Xanthomonadales bacterium]|jgi:monofunctional biosynthetic peptidoglycan transglycosylase|nr:monofunctional biosynthetic peptidoglycan transglycosylase [Xanthomonadales bacterium]